ncbi:MAG: hypothetical protein AB7L94_39000 [Kofleriaceae bacterium]
MPTLREELEEWEWNDIVALLDQPEDRANAALGAMWSERLATSDPTQILGFARCWSRIQSVAIASCGCARLVLDRVSRRARADATAAIETTERWARGDATLEDVWDARQRASGRAYEGDAVAEIASEAAEAAGDHQAGFDDEALASAERCATAVIAMLGETGRAQVIEMFRTTFGAPSMKALHDAHAARWT